MARKRAFHPVGTPTVEGVRIDLGDVTACAVRNERHDIAVTVRRASHFYRNLFGRIPVVRGVARLLFAVGRFFSGMELAAKMKPRRSVRGKNRFTELFRTSKQSIAALFCALLIPLFIAAGMLGLPVLAEYALNQIAALPRIVYNIVCCIMRLLGLVLTVLAITRLPLMDRLSMMRGAMAKVIYAAERHGKDVTAEQVRRAKPVTAESDGAFCLLVALLSVIAFACVRVEGMALQIPFRIGVILAVAALLNELLLPVENARAHSFGVQLRRPLSALQRLFTLEPNAQMIEVAMTAFTAALENDIPEEE